MHETVTVNILELRIKKEYVFTGLITGRLCSGNWPSTAFMLLNLISMYCSLHQIMYTYSFVVVTYSATVRTECCQISFIIPGGTIVMP